MRNGLYIPLLGLVLDSRRCITLGAGFSLEAVPKRVVSDIQSDRDMAIGYQGSLNKLAVTLAFRPLNGPGLSSFFSEDCPSLAIAIAIAQLLRLATGLPLVFPWWLYYTDTGRGRDRTQVYTYRHGPNYRYPVDDGPHLTVFRNIRKCMDDLVSRIRKYHANPRDDQRFVRAVEAASFAFQTRHIPPRLVNMVTFQEILFSTDRSEITHQLAERIAWYLNGPDGDGREKTYKAVKGIYRSRSTIVHGDSHWKKSDSIAEALKHAEHLNTMIVQMILRRGHIAAFSETGDKRQEFLERLGLGLKV